MRFLEIQNSLKISIFTCKAFTMRGKIPRKSELGSMEAFQESFLSAVKPGELGFMEQIGQFQNFEVSSEFHLLVLIISRIFGLFPVSGLSARDPKKIFFKRTSLISIYSFLCFISLTIFTVLQAINFCNHERNYKTAGNISKCFYPFMDDPP